MSCIGFYKFPGILQRVSGNFVLRWPPSADFDLSEGSLPVPEIPIALIRTESSKKNLTGIRIRNYRKLLNADLCLEWRSGRPEFNGSKNELTGIRLKKNYLSLKISRMFVSIFLRSADLMKPTESFKKDLSKVSICSVIT